ncbi:hypothetical protein [Mesorhizobium sp. M2E.F.Ca.ET.209.01.1.1]|uniref:hypothetical protein n=1 Tax=Mesorhizobium sp. M2E.F.Ca.ET.209.01.1.1 TaxID=2500526 RepID=UPI00167A6577|nr:hypothetical protein [Mesorhizobium sp. M2E.F.Ca.ET.209.01.1.1]
MAEFERTMKSIEKLFEIAGEDNRRKFLRDVVNRIGQIIMPEVRKEKGRRGEV